MPSSSPLIADRSTSPLQLRRISLLHAAALESSRGNSSTSRFTSEASVCHQFWLALQPWPTRTAAFTSRQKRLVVRGGCIPNSSRSSVTSSPTQRRSTSVGGHRTYSYVPPRPPEPMTRRRMLRHNAIEAWQTMQKTGWRRCPPLVR